MPCQTESQEIEKIFNYFKEETVEVIGAGMDWHSPYSCEEWAKNFNLTFPLLDDSQGENIYNYFGNGVVPYNIVIDRNGKLLYSKSGFNKDDIVNAIKNGLKVSNIEALQLDEKRFKHQQKTVYKKLLENKGIN